MLSEQDKTTLKFVADSPSLFQTIQRVVESQFTNDTVTGEMTNEQIGQITRARVDGLEKVRSAFKEIAECRTPKAPERMETQHPGR